MATPLILTGERTAPGIWHENYWFRRHEAAYAALPQWVHTAPGLVLDAGCGEGYASELVRLSWPSARVVGVDYDASAAAHASRAHAGPHTAFLRGAVTALSFRDAVCDLVVSLQVLEHIWTPGDLVRELVRVSRPGATVVLSTPNRLTFSPGLGRRSRPQNLYHCREYDAAELVSELVRWVPETSPDLYGLRHGPRLRAWEDEHGSLVLAQQSGPPESWPAALAEVVASATVQDFVIEAFVTADRVLEDRVVADRVVDEGADECLDLLAVMRRAP